MKRVIPVLALVGVVFAALLLLGGGFTAGQQNPIVTPTPAPVPPSDWPVGLPYPLPPAMVEDLLNRVAPKDPVGTYTSTIKITVGGAIPVTCENVVNGQQFLPDFLDAKSGKGTCAGLASQAISAMVLISTTQLAQQPTFDPFPPALPMPPQQLEIIVACYPGCYLMYAQAQQGEPVIALVENLGPGSGSILDTRWVLHPVGQLITANLESDGNVKIVYLGQDTGEYYTFYYPVPASFFKY